MSRFSHMQTTVFIVLFILVVVTSTSSGKNTSLALLCEKSLRKTALAGIMDYKEGGGSVVCDPPYRQCATIVCNVEMKHLPLTLGTITIRDCAPTWMAGEVVGKHLCEAQATDHWDWAVHTMQVNLEQYKLCNDGHWCNKKPEEEGDEKKKKK